MPTPAEGQDTTVLPCPVMETFCGPTVPAAGPSAERRGAPRRRCDLSARWLQMPAGKHDEWRVARVRDLSAGGFRLLLDRRLERGNVLMVELATADRGLPCQVVARAIHVSPEPDGWAVGCELAVRLHERHLRQFLPDSADEAQTAQRDSPVARSSADNSTGLSSPPVKAQPSS